MKTQTDAYFEQQLTSISDLGQSRGLQNANLADTSTKLRVLGARFLRVFGPCIVFSVLYRAWLQILGDMRICLNAQHKFHIPVFNAEIGTYDVVETADVDIYVKAHVLYRLSNVTHLLNR